MKRDGLWQFGARRRFGIPPSCVYCDNKRLRLAPFASTNKEMMRVWLVVVCKLLLKRCGPASVDAVDVGLAKRKRQKQKVSSGSACTRLLARLPYFSFFPPSCYCHENVMTGGEGGGWGFYAIVRQEWKLSYLPLPRYLSESGNRKILTLYADAFSLHVLKPSAQSRSTISAPPRCLTESRFGYSVRRAPSPPGYDDNRNWKYICFFCFKRNPLNINFFSFFFSFFLPRSR